MHDPYASETALEQARSIVRKSARAQDRRTGARPALNIWRNAPLTASVLLGTERQGLCRVRDTLTGQISLYPVSPRAFDALKGARGLVTVFVQDEKIVGFVICSR
jgi:hypothetical protein